MPTDPRVHTLRLREFGIPTRLMGSRLQPTATNEAYEFVRDFRDHYVTPRRPEEHYPADRSKIGKGLLYVGPPGTGKTTESVQVIQEIYFRYNVPVKFLAFADYIKVRTQQFGLTPDDERWWTCQSILEDVDRAAVLALDDVGKEHRTASGFAENELDKLLRQRHRDGKPTVITTNVKLREWGTTYNESMGSFIHEAYTHIPLIGKDHRRA